MTLAFEDANSKLVEVVTVADVDDEDEISYFGKQNSTLGSVVPLAMFYTISHVNSINSISNLQRGTASISNCIFTKDGHAD